jgi:3-hydroxyacyl-CoA dehydrogenase
MQNKTVGIIGAGRIGAAYARMMVEGHKMNLVYYDPYPNTKLVSMCMDECQEEGRGAWRHQGPPQQQLQFNKTARLSRNLSTFNVYLSTLLHVGCMWTQSAGVVAHMTACDQECRC